MGEPEALTAPGHGQREFLQVLNRLAIALRAQDVDAATKVIYFETLEDLAPEFLARAATSFALEPGRKWLPTTGEWRERAEAIRREDERRTYQRETRTEPWRDECSDCRDTGWLYDLECSGKGECGMGSCLRTSRRGPGLGPHTYATPCGCRDHNRTYQRHVLASSAAHREKAGA